MSQADHMRRVIDIPGHGPVGFPDTMSDDEVSAACKKLYESSMVQPTDTPGLANYRANNGAGVQGPPDDTNPIWRDLSKLGGSVVGGVAGGLASLSPLGIAGGVAAGFEGGGRIYDKVHSGIPLIQPGDVHDMGVNGGMILGSATPLGPLGAGIGAAAGGSLADYLEKGTTPHLGLDTAADAATGVAGYALGAVDSAAKAALENPEHLLGSGIAGFKQYMTGKADPGVKVSDVVNANPNTANDRNMISQLDPRERVKLQASAANGQAPLTTQFSSNNAPRQGGLDALDQALMDIRRQQSSTRDSLMNQTPGGDQKIPDSYNPKPVQGPPIPSGYAKSTLGGLDPLEELEATSNSESDPGRWHQAVQQSNAEKSAITSMDQQRQDLLERQEQNKASSADEAIQRTHEENTENETARIALSKILDNLDQRHQALVNMGAQPKADPNIHLPLFGHSAEVVAARLASDPSTHMPRSTILGYRPEAPNVSDALRSDRILNPSPVDTYLREPVGGQATDPVRAGLGGSVAADAEDQLKQRLEQHLKGTANASH